MPLSQKSAKYLKILNTSIRVTKLKYYQRMVTKAQKTLEQSLKR